MATLGKTTNQWQICNHECMNVSTDVAQRWNTGKLKVLQEVDEFLGDGPWFANGDSFENDGVTVGSNFHGAWGGQ